MSDLHSISGIDESSLELLEVAGYLDAASLAKATVDEISAELERANGILKIARSTPSRDVIAGWLSEAREHEGIGENESLPHPLPVDYEANPEVQEMLAAAPFAIPLPAKALVDRKLAVADIPAAAVLSHYLGDLDVMVEQEVPQPVLRPERKAFAPEPRSSPANGSVQVQTLAVDTAPTSKLDIDTSKVKSFDELGRVQRQVSSKPVSENDRVALLRAPLEKTNRGKDPKSRRYIRGVLHNNPMSIVLGAIVTLLLLLVLPLAIVSGILLLLSQQMPETFEWVPSWLIILPICLPVLGLAYLIWGSRGSCRVCGQRLFMPKNCLKNSKAHHVPGLGYIVPLSIHLLIFKWFRCTFCGTPVRLKK